MKTVDMIEAKTHFTSLCEEVVRTGQAAMVSERGKPLVLLMPAPAEEGSAREDILVARNQWEEAHPDAGDEPDSPDVGHTRGEPNPDPLAEA